MKKVSLIIMLTMLVLAWSAFTSHAAETAVGTSMNSCDHRSARIDSNGNWHFVCRGGTPDTESSQVVYSMVDSSGNLLIDATQLAVGEYKGKPYLSVDANNHVYVVWHSEEDDVNFSTSNPYAHAMDGTSADAGITTPVANPANTGDGTMDNEFAAAGSALTEDWTVTYNGSDWDIVGSVSGTLPDAADTGTLYGDLDTNIGIPMEFEITAGGTPFVSSDSFTFSTTQSVSLVLAAGPVISNFDALESVAPRIFVEPDTGRSHIVWFEGEYDDETFGGIKVRRVDSDGTKDAAFTVSQGHESSGYGGRDPEIFVDSLGNTHVIWVIKEDITGPYTAGIGYALIDGASSTFLIGVTTLFSDNFGYNMRSSMGMDPFGYLYVAFQNNYADHSTSETRVIVARFDPYAHALDGSTLFTNPTPTAGGSNTGDGTMDDLVMCPTTPTADWTVECIDNTTPGSEVWLVSNNVKANYGSATTGVPFRSDGFEVEFEITAGGTAFADGDTFTFSTANPAWWGPANMPVDEYITHPDLHVDQTGTGLHLAYYHHDNNDYYYLQLGYDLELLAGPIMASNNAGTLESPYLPFLGFTPPTDKAPALVQIVWAEDNDIYWNSLTPATNWPQVVLVNPDTGVPGDTVNITGIDFVDGATVYFGFTESPTVTFNSATSVDAEVPAGLTAGDYDVSLVNPDTLFSVLTDGFTVAGADDDTIIDDDTILDDDTFDDDVADDDVGDDDVAPDDDAADDDVVPPGDDDDDDDDDDGCCGC